MSGFLYLDYKVVVIEDACAAFNQSQQKFVIEDVLHHFGKRLTVAELIQQIQSRVFQNTGV